eukprot:5578900-Prymnesium_polylepis.1
MLEASESASAIESATRLRRALRVRKTYREAASWWHVLFKFQRYFTYNAVLVHILAVVAFERSNERMHLPALLSWVVTASVVGLFSVVFEVAVVSPRAYRSWLLVVELLGRGLVHLATISLFALHRFFRSWHDDNNPFKFDSVTGHRLSYFELYALVYAIVWLLDAVRLRGMLSMANGSQFLGRSSEMLRALANRQIVTYMLLWLLVLACKAGFDYFLIAEAIETTKRLWENPSAGHTGLYCWGYDAGNPTEWGCLRDNMPGHARTVRDNATGAYAIEMSAGYRAVMAYYRTLRAYYFSILVVGLRWSVPIFLCFADVMIFYTMFATLSSVLIGLQRSPAKIKTWAQLLHQFPRVVQLLNEKLISVEQMRRHAGERASASCASR